MHAEETILPGCFLIHDTFHGDHRGYFFESFNRMHFREQTGLDVNFVQDNQSLSQRGVLRGLHYQLGEHAQAKLVRVVRGKVLDVAVDLRPASPAFGKHVAVELAEDSHTQLFVPRGFAHGFVVLSEEAVVFYKVDHYYNRASEGGVIYNDPDLGIDWGIPEAELILSDKDKLLPCLKAVAGTLNFEV